MEGNLRGGLAYGFGLSYLGSLASGERIEEVEGGGELGLWICCGSRVEMARRLSEGLLEDVKECGVYFRPRAVVVGVTVQYSNSLS